MAACWDAVQAVNMLLRAWGRPRHGFWAVVLTNTLVPHGSEQLVCGAIRASSSSSPQHQQPSRHPQRPPSGGNSRSLAVLAFGGVCVGAAVHEMVYGGQPQPPHANDQPQHPSDGRGGGESIEPSTSEPDGADLGAQAASTASTGTPGSVVGRMEQHPTGAAPGAGSGLVATPQQSGESKPPWIMDEETGLIWHRRCGAGASSSCAFVHSTGHVCMPPLAHNQWMGNGTGRAPVWF